MIGDSILKVLQRWSSCKLERERRDRA